MIKKLEKVCSNVLTSIRKNAIILQTNKQTNKHTNKQTNKQTKVHYTLRKGVRLFSFNRISKQEGGNGLIHCSFSMRGALC